MSTATVAGEEDRRDAVLGELWAPSVEVLPLLWVDDQGRDWEVFVRGVRPPVEGGELALDERRGP